MQENLERIVRTALIAIQSSSEILLRYWTENRALAYSAKTDLSPVTPVDLEIEGALRQIILSEHPSHRIIGEEFGEIGDGGAPYSWYIDPIDGTKNFIRGLKFFGTQIAVFHGREIVVGVSSAPALNETIVAHKGGGAFLNGTKLSVSSVTRLDQAYVSSGSIKYFAENGKMANLLSLGESCWSLRGFGDFWSYHLLAAGSIDVILEAKTKIWDVAAASLIVKEAGGEVTDFLGHPISPDTTSIIATNSLLHAQVLELINEGAMKNPGEL